MQQSKTKKNRRMVDGITRREVLPKTIRQLNVASVEVSLAPTHFFTRRSLLSGIKMMCVATLTVMVFIGLSSVGSTVSYFSDLESSIGNRLQAGILGFRISSFEESAGRFAALEDTSSSTDGLVQGYATGISEENTGSKKFNITIDPDDSSLPIIYTVSSVLDAGNPEGCEEMEISAIFGDYVTYSGSLDDFVTPPLSQMGEWRFEVELPEGIDELGAGAECRGEIVFRAGLDEVSDDLTHTFSDEKKYFFVIKNWGEAPLLEEEKILRTPQIEFNQPFIPDQSEAESESGGAGGEGAETTDGVPELPVDESEEETLSPALPDEEESQASVPEPEESPASEPEPEDAIEDEAEEPEVEKESAEAEDEPSGEPSQEESAPSSDGATTE